MPNPNFTLPIQYSLSTSFLPLISGSISLKSGKIFKTDFEIDNGLNGWLLLPKSFIKRNNIPDSEITKSYGEPMHDAYKGQNISLIRIANMQIGKLALKGVPAFVSDFKYPAIGKNVLERFDFMLDYPANTISFFAIPDSAGTCFFSQPFGTGLIAEKTAKGEVVIKGIWKGSQADKNGIKLNDKIISVDGFSIDSMSAIAINSLLNESATADNVNLVIEQVDGKQRIITINKSIYSVKFN